MLLGPGKRSLPLLDPACGQLPWCQLLQALRGEFFVQKAAGQSGPRLLQWGLRAAGAGES